MAGEWKYLSVSSVAVPVLGGTPDKSEPEYWGGEILWATAKDIASVRGRYLFTTEQTITQAGLEHSAAKLLPKGTVVITARGTVGAIAQLATDMSFNQTCYGLVPKKGIDPDFLYYVLKGTLFEMKSLTYGTVFETITMRSFEHWIIPVPPLPIQRTIAHILGTLDDKIELLRRMNETLEATARALFKSWFVDFDPVIDNALETGNPIPDEIKEKAKRRLALGERRKLLPEHIRRLFPDRFVDSELGPIPDGWKIKSLDEIAEYLNGIAWQKYRAKEGEPSLPVIKIRELREGITPASDRASMDVPEEYIVEDGDVLFSWSGSLLVKIWCGGQGVLNQHLFKVSSKRYPKWFYYLWTSEHLDRFRRIAADKATTMGHIKRAHLSESHVIVPDSTLLSQMTSIIEPIIEQRVANEIACRTLANIRDALLPKLVSGEIRVKDAKGFLKARGL